MREAQSSSGRAIESHLPTVPAPYRRPDFQRIKALLAQPVIFDGRNLFDAARMREVGFEYTSVGRAKVKAAEGVPA